MHHIIRGVSEVCFNNQKVEGVHPYTSNLGFLLDFLNFLPLIVDRSSSEDDGVWNRKSVSLLIFLLSLLCSVKRFVSKVKHFVQFRYFSL